MEVIIFPIYCIAGFKGLLTLCMLMLCINATLAVNGKIKQRINYGVLFKYVGRMDLSEQMWQHTFEIKLPDVIPMHVPNKTIDDAWGE